MKLDPALARLGIAQAKAQDLSELKSAGADGRLEEVAQQFEALLLGQMMKSMRNTVPEGVLTQSMGQDIFTSMLDEEFAKQAASLSPLGLAATITGQLGGARADGVRPVGAPLTADAEIMRDGAWVRPLQRLPNVSPAQSFGAARKGDRPAACGGGHCGTDYADAVGTEVYAVRKGVVARVDRDAGGEAGRQVTIRHDSGFVSTYIHLDAVEAKLEPGSVVNAGTPIGAMGNTGTASRGSHLHFELSRFGNRIDVESFAARWKMPGAMEEMTQGEGRSVDEMTVKPQMSPMDIGPMGPNKVGGIQ